MLAESNVSIIHDGMGEAFCLPSLDSRNLGKFAFRNMDELQNIKCANCEEHVELYDARQCSFCGGNGAAKAPFYCTSCTEEDCPNRKGCMVHETCWDSHLPKSRKQAERHKMINLLPQLFVSAVTYSESDKEKQRFLHKQDAIARWFDIEISQHDEARLRIYDRFSQLCDPKGSGNKENTSQYPVFVSFIGHTCVGKSTLLRAMLLMGKLNLDDSSSSSGSQGQNNAAKLTELLSTDAIGPVTRSGNLDDLTKPTTRGVHLYREDSESGSSSRKVERPLLFADCEGFRGGIATTNSEKYSRSSSTGRQRLRSRSPLATLTERDDRGERFLESPCYAAPDAIADLPIKAASYGSSGKKGVELFYARFLYAISNVVVFVTKDDTTFSEDLTHLFEWAASAVFKSVNNPSHKSLIIVRNMAASHDKRFYDRGFLRSTYFTGLKNLWEGSSELKDFVHMYNSQQDRNERFIRSNNDLFRLFFDSISCCYIPDVRNVRGEPDELFNQYRNLRNEIIHAPQDDQLTKSPTWMKWNVPTLTHIINRAFDHFRTSDGPFDFYDAARNNNASPSSTSDHIANFLRHAYGSSYQSGNVNGLISEVISICLVIREARARNQVISPAEIYERNLKDLCAKAYNTYVRLYQKCSFAFSGGDACIKRPSSQHGQHFSQNGKIQPGPLIAPPKQNSRFLETIREDFIRLYASLHNHDHIYQEDDPSERHSYFNSPIRHQRRDLYHNHRAFWSSVKSNKTCLACLQAVPDHVLKCGHAYCVQCVKEFGEPSERFECDWEMTGCALCSIDYPGDRYLIRLKPRCAGVRILTLDGGGVRGIIELALLQAVHQAIGLGDSLPLRAFFDLIVGTSTGGIIALALATTDIRVSEMKSRFMDLSRNTFKTRREGQAVRWIDPFKVIGKVLMALRIVGSIYATTPLKQGLIDLFQEDTKLFSYIQAAGLPYSTRVAVTSAKDSTATKCLIASYNRPDLQNCEDFEREDENTKEMKIWEAGLATSAAPFYFTPYQNPATQKDYVDGALYANCPASVALEEMDKIWPDGSASLDILLSVGTGIQKRDERPPALLRFGGMEKVFATFFRNLNTEGLWKTFIDSLGGKSVKNKLHRLNASITSDYISLDEYRKMGDLDRIVHEQLHEIDGKPTTLSSAVEKTATTLIANLFFFEPNDHPSLIPVKSFPAIPNHQTTDLHHIPGTIRCRLAFESKELKDVLEKIESFWYAEIPSDNTGSASVTSLLEPPPHSWEQIKGFRQMRSDILANRKRKFRLPLSLKTWDRSEALLLVAVKVKGYEGRVPVSGFPATLKEAQRRAALG